MPRATALVLVGALALAGCADGGGGREESPAVSASDSSVPDTTIEAALEAHTDSLLSIPGVVGTAIGLCDDAPCIHVFVLDSGAAERARIPERLGGHRVEVRVTGEFRPRGS